MSILINNNARVIAGAAFGSGAINGDVITLGYDYATSDFIHYLRPLGDKWTRRIESLSDSTGETELFGEYTLTRVACPNMQSTFSKDPE